jgi:hypothetical protein
VITAANYVKPVLLFVMGAALAITLPRKLSAALTRVNSSHVDNGGSARGYEAAERSARFSVLCAVLMRSVLLLVIGVLLNNGFQLSEWRLTGTLQMFAIAYLLVGTLMVFTGALQLTCWSTFVTFCTSEASTTYIA